MMPFFPRSRLRAADLNDVVDRADSAHIAGGGFLAVDNGFEQSVRDPRRLPPPGARPAAPKTDTAIADADEAAPQNRSVEVRAAVAATEADPATGADATPAAPAALQLYRFDEPEPDTGDGISATVTVPEKGGTCTVDFGLPAGATPGTAEIMLAARRIDPDTGARSLAWLKLGVAPGSEDGEEGGGEDEPEVEPPPCGNPLNGPETDPTPEPEDHTAIEDSDPPLDEAADPTPGDGGKTDNPLDHPGDGGYTPACGGEPT